MQNYCILTLAILFFSFSGKPKKEKVQLDERAKKYIPTEKQSALNDVQIESLNFFFRSSYIIQDIPGKCPGCSKIDIQNFDVKKFDKQRAEKKRVVVFETRPGLPITLLSWEEVRAAYTDIAKEYSVPPH